MRFGVHRADVDLARQLQQRDQTETFGGRWERPHRWRRAARRGCALVGGPLVGCVLLAALLYGATACGVLFRLSGDAGVGARTVTVIAHDALVRALVVVSGPIYLLLQAVIAVVAGSSGSNATCSLQSMSVPLALMYTSLAATAAALLVPTPPYTGIAALATVTGWLCVFVVLVKRILLFEGEDGTRVDDDDDDDAGGAGRRVTFRTKSPAP